ncbi:hypothetical protein TNCV_2580731 [Trichonephila clavipes]|nr:hypothetical protein TNCV_2580731 [Trichonephila clavipes]
MSRSNECSSERNERLLLDRIRHSLLRSQNSEESREQRLENDRIQHAVSRSLESDDSREQRLEDDRIRHAASRSLESDDSRQQRLEDYRIRHAASRSLESDGSREQRVEDDRISTLKQRLEHDRIRHVVSRLLDLSDSREKRLERIRRLHQKQREFGSQEQHVIRVTEQCDRYHDRERRLFTSRQTTSALRDIESEENRRQRLNNDQIRRTNRRNIAWREKYNCGSKYNAQINYSDASEIGPMNVCCNYCKALRGGKMSQKEFVVLLVKCAWTLFSSHLSHLSLCYEVNMNNLNIS